MQQSVLTTLWTKQAIHRLSSTSNNSSTFLFMPCSWHQDWNALQPQLIVFLLFFETCSTIALSKSVLLWSKLTGSFDSLIASPVSFLSGKFTQHMLSGPPQEFSTSLQSSSQSMCFNALKYSSYSQSSILHTLKQLIALLLALKVTFPWNCQDNSDAKLI